MKALKITFFLLLFTAVSTFAQQAIQPESSVKENKPEHLDKPYVILISLDGFRYDYVEKFKPKHLSRFVKKGVAAESLIPCFPSKTFPNHYSIATGMYPENHDLVNNTYYNPVRGETYRINEREKVEDGSWYKGTPIWVQAAKSGMVTASFFFVGSEANIQGVLPTYYYQYDGSIPNSRRTEQVVEWLQLPEKERPHLITLYFSDMDSRGHAVGPGNEKELNSTLIELDQTLGDFFKKLKKLKLDINLIIVSDHGMADVPMDHFMPFEPYEDDDRWKTVNGGSLLYFYMNEGQDIEKAYQDLKAKENHFRVYKTIDSPYFRAKPENPNNGDIIAVAELGYYFSDARRIARMKKNGVNMTGQHGYPVSHKEMHGIFYAKGPAFKKRTTISSFENIHIYPLICEVLNLKVPEEVDGNKEVLKPALK
jgi:predicted AlkP superfamily pyrophosphatase or phosphodiesterase